MNPLLGDQIAGIPFAAVLALEGLPADDAVSYFSGSLVSGYGNAWSDIDVYVVGEKRPSGQYIFTERHTLISIHYAFTRRIDFEFWPSAVVNALAARLAAIKLGEALPDELFLPSEEAFIHRLRIGVTTSGQEASFERLRVGFDFDKFRRYLVQKSLRWTDGLVEDVCGMMESDDYLTAVLAAREMVGFAVDAYCHAHGNTDPSRKWRMHHLKLAACQGAHEIEKRYLELSFPQESLREAKESPSRAYTDACLTFVNYIASLVQK